MPDHAGAIGYRDGGNDTGRGGRPQKASREAGDDQRCALRSIADEHQDASVSRWLSKLGDVMYDVDDIIDLFRIKGRQHLEIVV